MACSECHAAKVRCDKESPCRRCVRLKLLCTPHISRQGQGKKKRKLQQHDAAAKLAGDGLEPTEDGTLLQQVVVTSSGSGEPTTVRQQRDHYGVRYLIRSWLSFSLRRRSFSLLSRASKLAARLGIAMDEILCEQEGQRGMEFLYPVLLVPASEQRVLGSRLDWTELPQALRVATGTYHQTPETALATNHKRHWDNRWIWAREMRQGQSRYLVSKAFDRDVASIARMEQTWEENKESVVDLFLDTQERAKHTKLFAHQISLHAVPNKVPEASRSKLRLKVGKQTVNVDQIQCISIVDLDTAYMFVEYVQTPETTAATAATLAATVNDTNPSNPITKNTNSEAVKQELTPAEVEEASELADLNFIDFDDLVGGQDLDFVLGILEE